VGTYAAYWTGLVYANVGRSNDEAVAALVNQIATGTPVQLATSGLRGSFCMNLHDSVNQVHYTFVDDSGLYTAYRSNRGVSTSFLDLCRTSGVTSASFDKTALLELMHLGNVYFGDTLAPDVKKLRCDEVVVLRHNDVSVLKKPISQLSDTPQFKTIEAATSALATAIRNCAVSVDLTGGFDSRLVACLLKGHGLEFESALSGAVGTADYELGKQVAGALNVPYFHCEYSAATILDDLEYTLNRLDGMGGSIVAHHRLNQLSEQRSQRGITLSLKGSGGELFKDFFWTQDFPFYRSKQTRMDRLNRVRLEFELFTSDTLTDDAMTSFSALRRSRVAKLESQYRQPINTQSYDHVYFYERVQTWNSRMITSCQRPDVSIHSPLSELLVAQLGFQAPRTKRFYNRYHRDVITRLAPATAAVRTTDGTTASSSTLGMLMDATGYVKGKSKKLSKKLSQLLLNTTKFNPPEYSPDTQSLQRISTSEICAQALTALKEQQLLKPSVELKDISPRFQEQTISAGWAVHCLQ
ncbi:MAG: hypothetical protein KDA92_21555, partial [Planctomycetales bacterium]|nr:hypothetical protein [Planctomycetales bacterium]